MHGRRKLPAFEDEAVSEILGTLILIALIAGAITILGTVLLSQPPPGKVPAAAIVITNESNVVLLYHEGGDPVPAGDLAILINGNTVPFSGAGSDNVWGVGETLTAVAPALPREVTVVLSGSTGKVILVSAAPEIR